MLGCDFEAFLYINNEPVPAERLLSGSKDNAMSIAKGVVAHPDNVMAEAAISSPVEPANFSAAVLNALCALREYVDPAELRAQASVKFTQDWLDESSNAGEVGCEPDFNTSGEQYQYSPRDLGLYRYAGFHIHFDVPRAVPRDYATRVVDCTVGLASIAFGWDTGQGRRRQYYGTAGRHRVKPYGIEYRTLSSNMLNHIEESSELITKVGMGLENTDTNLMMLPQLMWDATKTAIETEDVAMAQALWEEVKKAL